MEHGVEGQVWRDGVLVASRWWAEAPDGAAWAVFLRSASVSGPLAAPTVQSLPLQAIPWGRQNGRLAWSPVQLEGAGWRVVIGIIGLALGWQFMAGMLWFVASAWQSHTLDALRRDAAPLIADREQAEAALQRIDALSALAAAPDDYTLIADVRDRLPEEARLLAWTRDASRLRFQVQSAESDPRVFVQAFRDHPVLGSVVANPTEPGRMLLEVGLAGEGAAP